MATQKPLTVADIIDDVLDREGRGAKGWVNDPADMGGPTNHGITLQRLELHLGRKVSIDELRKLTDEQAAEIYLADFVKAPGFDRIPDPELQALVVDCGVHHGPEQATKWLQEAVDAKADGAFGPRTAEAVAKADPGITFNRVLAQRFRKFGRIVTNNPSQSKFMAGWADRAADFLDGDRF